MVPAPPIVLVEPDSVLTVVVPPVCDRVVRVGTVMSPDPTEEDPTTML